MPTRPATAAFALALVVALAAVMSLPLCSSASDAATTRPATAPASQQSEPLTLDLGDGVDMQFILIQAGSFAMGEAPGRQTTITAPFYLGKTLVTRKQFAAFIKATGHRTEAELEGKSPGVKDGNWQSLPGAYWDKPGFEQADDHPVVCVSPNDAMTFCRWLSERTGKKVRLPRDAEWEYACRAGTQTRYFWGDNPMDGVGYMNAEDGNWKIEKGIGAAPIEAAWSDGYRFTSPATAMKPNPWGLCDMLGNLWQPTTDPLSWRGGTWDYPPNFNRCTHRQNATPTGNSWDTGFRVAIENP